jgi:hypothetical protein
LKNQLRQNDNNPVTLDKPNFFYYNNCPSLNKYFNVKKPIAPKERTNDRIWALNFFTYNNCQRLNKYFNVEKPTAPKKCSFGSV